MESSTLAEEPLINSPQCNAFQPANRSLCCCAVNERRLAGAAAVYSMVSKLFIVQVPEHGHCVEY